MKRQATDQKKMQQIKPPADGIQNLPRILKNKEKKIFSIEKQPKDIKRQLKEKVTRLTNE